MPRCSTHHMVAISVVVTAAIASPCRAQAPDTNAVPRSAVAVISAPTVIALASDTTGSPLGPARVVAHNLGFTLVVRKPPLRQIVDKPHSAVYYVPRDWSGGYLIIAPGRRPDVVRSLVAADSLRVRILAYLRVHRELRAGSD